MAHTTARLAALLGLLLVGTARADFMYTFTTTSPAPIAGSVTGWFRVSDSVLVDGFLDASRVMSFHFDLPDAQDPFFPHTFDSSLLSDSITITTHFPDRTVASDGTFLSDATGNYQLFEMVTKDFQNSKQEVVDIKLNSSIAAAAVVTGDIGGGTTIGPVLLSGTWTGSGVTPVVPEPSSILLVLMTGACGAAFVVGRRPCNATGQNSANGLK
jgi:hypothetical protein